eukprot:1038123-Prorocentrum_minimum.AAC.2
MKSLTNNKTIVTNALTWVRRYARADTFGAPGRTPTAIIDARMRGRVAYTRDLTCALTPIASAILLQDYSSWYSIPVAVRRPAVEDDENARKVHKGEKDTGAPSVQGLLRPIRSTSTAALLGPLYQTLLARVRSSSYPSVDGVGHAGQVLDRLLVLGREGAGGDRLRRLRGGPRQPPRPLQRGGEGGRLRFEHQPVRVLQPTLNQTRKPLQRRARTLERLRTANTIAGLQEQSGRTCARESAVSSAAAVAVALNTDAPRSHSSAPRVRGRRASPSLPFSSGAFSGARDETRGAFKLSGGRAAYQKGRNGPFVTCSASSSSSERSPAAPSAPSALSAPSAAPSAGSRPPPAPSSSAFQYLIAARNSASRPCQPARPRVSAPRARRSTIRRPQRVGGRIESSRE